MYDADYVYTKLLAWTIWNLDVLHTAFIWVTLWAYLIDWYGQAEMIDRIPWALPLTIVFTALLQFIVYCFYAHRIWRLSKKNWMLTGTIIALAIFRLASATVTTGKMLVLGSLDEFKSDIEWIFTLGLALSSGMDVLITGSLWYYLRASKRRGGAENLNDMINSLIIYALDTGAVTCAGSIVSMICWLTMPYNLIFIGLHFVLAKLYANSLFVVLNTRKSISSGRKIFTRGSSGNGSNGRNAIVLVEGAPMRGNRNTLKATDSKRDTKSAGALKINVERTIQYTSDYDIEGHGATVELGR